LFLAAERAFGGLPGSGRAGRAGRVFGRLPRENRGVPESAATSAERKRRVRTDARRAEAVRMLQIAECGCRYAAGQLGNGLGPEQARELAMEMAAELTAVAEGLRRLTRMGPRERRVLAVKLHSLGVPPKRIAQQLGVCDRTVRNYLAGRQG
jgi:hypothetical protein